MKDIIERLRWNAKSEDCLYDMDPDLLAWAADEIERLREALAELYAADLAPRDANHGREWQNALRKAEAALRKPEPTP